MPIYADKTQVSESNSKVELDEMLRKWKASNVAVGGSETEALVYFAVAGWNVKFKMAMPTDADARKHGKKDRWGGISDSARAAWIEQERRRRWRALVLTIKAKLVSVENAVESFENAFLAHLVIEGGATVGDRVGPALAEAKAGGPVAGFLGSGR